MTNRAFIIGNGRSREGFDLERLSEETTFGCNALYRDWWPTYLVAIDDKIIQEIEESNFPLERFIEPDDEEKWEPAEVNPARPRSNAGMNAMMEAIRRGHDELWCLGFDFLIADRGQSVSNIYDGTNAYGPETRANPQDNFGRIRFLAWLVGENPDITFNFVFDRNDVYTLIEDEDTKLKVWKVKRYEDLPV